MAQYLPPAPDGAASPGPIGLRLQAHRHGRAELLPGVLRAHPVHDVRGSDDEPVHDARRNAAGRHAQRPCRAAPDAVERDAVPAVDVRARSRRRRAALRTCSRSIEASPAGMQAAYTAVDNVRQLIQAHRAYNATWDAAVLQAHAGHDGPHLLPRDDGAARCASASTPTGRRTGRRQAEWETALLESYYEAVVWHEFGHVMSMEHNFMGSIDKANWPTYKDWPGQHAVRQEQLQHHGVQPDRGRRLLEQRHGDQRQPDDRLAPLRPGRDRLDVRQRAERAERRPEAAGYAGRRSADRSVRVRSAPPRPGTTRSAGTGSTEKQFLFCSHEHIRYTPLCRQFDLGSTPSEITAADIEAYEWNYNWRNFRQYYKVWDDSSYATNVTNMITDMRRFTAMQYVGLERGRAHGEAHRGRHRRRRPAPRTPASSTRSSRTTSTRTSARPRSSSLPSTRRSSSSRPASGPSRRPYDPYFGDVVQQGISVDKEVCVHQLARPLAVRQLRPDAVGGLLGQLDGQAVPAISSRRRHGRRSVPCSARRARGTRIPSSSRRRSRSSGTTRSRRSSRCLRVPGDA